MIKIHIDGWDKAGPAISGAVGRGVDAALTVCGARGQQLVQQNITSPYLGRPPAVCTGVLANSISFEISRDASISRETVFAQPPADQYAAYVETGTGRHFPPPQALLLWVQRKFGVDDEKQALSIAFAIARKIAQRGTLAFGMFARAFGVLQGEVAGIFQAQIAQAIDEAGLAKR